MISYAARRLLLLAPVVAIGLTLLFLLFFANPAEDADERAQRLAGGSRAPSEEVIQNIKDRYGMEDPLLTQYTDFWGRTLRFDLGESYQNNRSVNEILGDTAAASLRLTFWALLVEVVIGIAAGVLSAVRRYSFADGLVTVSTAAVSAVPVFVLGYVLQQAFGVFPNQNDWPEWARLKVQGIGPDTWAFGVIPTGDQWRYLVLPALVLASVSTALVARLTRATMLEVSRADFMRTARAKGLTERQVVYSHGLRNALIPVITFIALDIGNLFGSAILTETVFNWPGIGSTVAEAARFRDAPVVLSLTMLLLVGYVIVNLLVDLAYAVLDPRIRYGQEARTA